MATISDLNVRLGLLTTEFDKNLAKVERQMQRTANNLSRLGSDLMVAVSAPLAIFGGSAIKAAGEIESLRLAMEATFTAAGRSVEEARAELDALRQAALAPGLDFEQAVRGSIRLQSVGFSAEYARKILVQLANAIASTGGTAIELDSVTRQFTQMIAKGRILQEDLTIIQENMPSISDAMEKAFGTRSADRLREMGVTAEQFIAGITKQLETLPRVQGGISNALVNLTSGQRNQMARLGEEINRTFNIGNLSDRFINAVRSVVDWFSSLEDSSKRAIVNFALLAVAAGPAVKVMAALYGVGGQMLHVFRQVAASGPSIVAFFKAMQTGAINASGGLGRMVTAFKALDTATKVTTIGAVIAVVVALGAALYTLTNRTNEAAAAQKVLSEVQTSAVEAATREAAKAEELVRVFSKENASREEKKRAIEALKQINPEYFGQLDAEKATTEDVTAALKAYTKELIRAATVKQAVDKIGELKVAMSDLKEEAELSTVQTGFIALKSAVTGIVAPFNAASNAVSNAAKQATSNAATAKSAYEAQIKALEKLIDENSKASDVVNGFAGATGATVENTQKMDSALESVNANLAAYEERMKLAGEGSRDTNAEIKLLSTSIDKLLRAGFSSASPEVEKLNQKLEAAKEAAKKGVNEFAELDAITDKLLDKNDLELDFNIKYRESISIPDFEPLSFQGVNLGIPEEGVKSLNDAKQGMDGLKASLDSYVASVQASIEPMTFMQNIMNGLQAGTLSFSEAYRLAVENIAQSGTVVQNVALAIGGAMQQAANEGASSFKQLAQAALAGAAKVARAYIIEGVSSTVASALKTVPFPFNLAVGAAAGAAAGALFNKAIGAIGIPALASGGVISGPTLALLGEYPGAGSNPEIAAPESKLRNIFREEGAAKTEVFGIIRGEDILISTERAAANRRRVR